MGRAKAKMEFIKKEKIRNKTFRDRSISLKKKVYELATLCDIKAVLIIYGPKQDTPQADPIEPQIWPENRDEVVGLIDKYKGQSPEDRDNKTTLLPDFFKDRNKKAQQALTTLREKNLKSKYPTTLDQGFNSLKEEDLRKNVVILENKIGYAKAKLEQMKANIVYRASHVQQQQQLTLNNKRSRDFDAENQANKSMKNHPYQAISGPMRVPILMPIPIQQQRINSFTEYNNWNQMMLKFGNEYGVGPSNIVHNAPLSQVVYDYPRMGGTIDSISYANNFTRAPQNYYSEGRQPVAPQLMEYHPMTQQSTSHQMAAAPPRQYYEEAPPRQYYEDRKWQW